MRVDIRARKIDVDEELRDHVTRRLGFALGRFGRHVAKVMIRFNDANGTRGGVDKQCHVAVSLRPSGTVLVEDVDASLVTVVDRAADRAARAVERDIQRRRESARP